MSPWRPVLRRDLVFLPPDEKGLASLQDPVLNRTVPFDDLGIAVARALDGSRPIASVPGPRDEVERHVRNMLLLVMFEGSGEATLERARSLDAYAAQDEPVLLPGARFACQGSGQCCQVYEFGPLRDDDVARLQALEPRLRERFPQLGTDPLTDPQENGLFLRKTGPRCTFLLDDGRCGIHAHFGPEAKPSFCRMFPWRAKLTLEGLKVFDQLECATFATSARSGPTLEEQLPFVRSLLPAELWLEHPYVHLDDHLLADFGWIARLQDRAVALVHEGRGAATTLARVGRLFATFAATLASCPLEANQPEEALSRALARPVEAAPVERGPRRDALRELAGVLQELIGCLRDTPASPGLRPVLDAALALALAELDPGSVALEPAWAAARALPLTDDAEEVLRLSRANALFGDGALLDERLRPAVIRFALVHLLAVTGGRLAAHAAGRGEVLGKDLSLPHSLAGIVFREEPPRKVFRDRESVAFSVIEAAALLS